MSDRSPYLDQPIIVVGSATNGTKQNKIVAHSFDFGNGTGTGWMSVSSWPGQVVTSVAYNVPGFYQLQFSVLLASGATLGGSGACAIQIKVESQRQPQPIQSTAAVAADSARAATGPGCGAPGWSGRHHSGEVVEDGIKHAQTPGRIFLAFSCVEQLLSPLLCQWRADELE